MDAVTIDSPCRSEGGAQVVGRWRSMACHCRDLAARGKVSAAQAEFAELNRQVGRFLSDWEKPAGEFEVVGSKLDRLLDEVISWRDDPSANEVDWTWRFHHASLTD